MDAPSFLAAAAADPNALPKAIAAVIGSAIAAGLYLYGRLSKLPAAKAEAAGGRVALAPEDRDLAFTIVRTGTDLTRALHDHGEILREAFPYAPPLPPSPPPAPTRRPRTRT